MKAIKAVDLRAKTSDELKDQLLSLKKEQFNFRFQKTAGQMQGTLQVRHVRRTIAKIKTILGEQARLQKASSTRKGK